VSAVPPPPVPAFEFSLASRGISKGLAQTDGPQFVGRAELSAGPLYVGGLWKNVTSTTAKGEADLSIGVRTKAAGFNLAGSATARFATSAVQGADNEALELSGSVSRKMGRLTPQFSVTWSPDDLGPARRSTYAEASAAYGFSPRTSVSLAIGHRDRQNGPSYTAFNVGVTHTVGRHLTADLRYYRTNKHDLGYTYQPGLVASVRARF
jgi:predicted porin